MTVSGPVASGLLCATIMEKILYKYPDCSIEVTWKMRKGPGEVPECIGPCRYFILSIIRISGEMPELAEGDGLENRCGLCPPRVRIPLSPIRSVMGAGGCLKSSNIHQ